MFQKHDKPEPAGGKAKFKALGMFQKHDKPDAAPGGKAKFKALGMFQKHDKPEDADAPPAKTLTDKELRAKLLEEMGEGPGKKKKKGLKALARQATGGKAKFKALGMFQKHDKPDEGAPKPLPDKTLTDKELRAKLLEEMGEGPKKKKGFFAKKAADDDGGKAKFKALGMFHSPRRSARRRLGRRGRGLPRHVLRRRVARPCREC